VATLDEVRAKAFPVLQSDGTPAYKVTPEQAARAEVFVAPPLSALSPRMLFLEGLLADYDRARLAHDPAKLLARFGPEKAGVWDAGSAAAPARLLRDFLPPDEGGVDKAGRAAWLRSKAMPWLSIRQSFPEMPNPESEGQVSRVVTALYRTYDARPREQLLRGQLEEATRRLVRIHDEYQAERDAFRDVEQVRKTRQDWAGRVQKAYLDLVNAKAAAQQAPQDAQVQAGLRTAQKQVDALLDDSYLVSLALGEDEVGMMKEDDNPKKAKRSKRGLLTSVVMQSTMPTLGADTAYLQALARQERAEQKQAQLDRQRAGRAKPEARAEREAVAAWKNTQKGWDAYLTDYPLTPPEAGGRLTYIVRLNRGTDLYPYTALSLLEDLFQDVSMAAQARLLRARALEKAGDVAAAREALAKLPAELTALERVLESLEKGGFQEIRRIADQRLRQLEPLVAQAGPKAEPPLPLTNLRNLSRDVSAMERGGWRDNVRWLRAAAAARLAQLPAAK
jgi:hypothetical protein